MINKEHLFQKLMLFTIEGYLDDISPDETYNYVFMLKLRSQIRGYMTFARLDKEEYLYTQEMAKKDFALHHVERMIDRNIFALELLYLYVTRIDKKERAFLNISDKKLKNAKASLVMDMISFKSRATKEDHSKIQDIVKESRLSAKLYFEYHHTYIIGE